MKRANGALVFFCRCGLSSPPVEGWHEVPGWSLGCPCGAMDTGLRRYDGVVWLGGLIFMNITQIYFADLFISVACGLRPCRILRFAWIGFTAPAVSFRRRPVAIVFHWRVFLQSAEFRVQRSDNTHGGVLCVFFIFERGGEL